MVIRAFIAIAPDAAIRDRLAAALRDLSVQPSVRLVPAHNLHLTLVFIGAIDPAREGAIGAAMAHAAAQIPPFQLRINGTLAAVGNRRRLIAAAVDGEVDRLALLRRRVQESLAEIGFPPAEARFRPHLTVARLRPRATARERDQIWRQAESRLAGVRLEFRVDELALYRSRLRADGASYTRLRRARIGG